MEDLASEIRKKQAQIDEFTGKNKKAKQDVEYIMAEPQSVEKPEESNQPNDEQQPEEVKEGEKSIQNEVEGEVDEPARENLAQISQENA